MLWKLPVLYIVENNRNSMSATVERFRNTEIYKLAAAYNMPAEQVEDGMSPESIHIALEKAVKHVRSNNGPYFFEIKT